MCDPTRKPSRTVRAFRTFVPFLIPTRHSYLLAIFTLSLFASWPISAQTVSFSRSDITTGLSLAGGIVSGDLNGDGKPDLVVTTHTIAEPLAIYVLLGNGDGTFSSPSQVFSGCCSGLAVADLNGDGKLDIAFSGISGLWVYLGNGDGTFNPGPHSAGVASGRPPAIADLNGDGKLDIAFALQDGGIGVALGNGDGTFGPFKVYPNGGVREATAVVAADFNGDGKLDLAANNFGTPPDFLDTPVSVLLGNGDGTFGSPTLYTVGSIPLPLVAATLNHDDKVDLAAGNALSSTVSILIGKGDGTFLPKMDFPVGSPAAMTAADFNLDGNRDLATCGPVALTVLLADGDGTFGAAQDFPAAGSCMAMATADFNLDGKPDVALAYDSGNGTITVFLNTTTSSVVTTTTLASSINPSAFGQAVTLTAHVTSASGTPTGTVTFREGAVSLGTATLVNGTASISVSSLSAGSHWVTSAYQASGEFGASASVPVIQIVDRATTTTSLIPSHNPVPVNRPVTYAATVVSQFGSTMTGTVTFRDGDTTIASVPLAGSQAKFKTSYSIIGVHTITVAYSGDSNNMGSTSGTVTEQVTGLASKTALTTSGSPSMTGQPVTFTATVNSKLGTIPDGDLVTFYDGKTRLGTVPLVGGTSAFTTSSLSTKNHTIRAVYPGDQVFKKSSASVLQVVEP